MSRYSPHPDQKSLTCTQRAQLEEVFAARASIQAEAQALRWRLRLIALESAMMAAFLFGGSLALHLSLPTALRNAALFGGGCFVAASLIIGLATVTGRLLGGLFERVETWIAKRRRRP